MILDAGFGNEFSDGLESPVETGSSADPDSDIEEAADNLLLDSRPDWALPAAAAQETYLGSNSKYQFHAKDSYATDCEMHEYVTPDGTPGYTIMQYMVRNGTLHRRRQNVGPEAWRNQEWVPVA